MFLSCHKFYYFYSLSVTSLIPPHFHFTFQFLIYLLSYFFFFLSAVNCFLISNWFVLPAPASNEFASKLVLFYDYEVLTFLAIFSNKSHCWYKTFLIDWTFLFSVCWAEVILYCRWKVISNQLTSTQEIDKFSLADIYFIISIKN